MAVWTLADLHLAFGAPEKSMEVFGPDWKDYGNRIQDNWRQVIGQEDLVLIPGDISWSMKFENALIDLNWIDALPGTKLIIKGNHDYWWPSNKKLQEGLPPSIHYVQNNAFLWNDIAIGGTRLWDTPEYSFEEITTFQENPLEKPKKIDPEQTEKIFLRELERLRLSLSQLDASAKIRIVMTHYPPISADLKPSRASQILEEFNINICTFGHLHNIKKDRPIFGEKNGILYAFASCDYLACKPLLLIPTM